MRCEQVGLVSPSVYQADASPGHGTPALRQEAGLNNLRCNYLSLPEGVLSYSGMSCWSGTMQILPHVVKVMGFESWQALLCARWVLLVPSCCAGS